MIFLLNKNFFLFLLIFFYFPFLLKSNKCEKNDLVKKNEKNEKISEIKWAILCLIRRDDTYQNNRRNKAIISTFQPYSYQYNITILFFSEDNFLKNEINEWIEQFFLIGKVKFIDIKSKAYYMPTPKYGYKWMCKFFTVDLYEYLIDYDYYIRIDSDNILQSSINYPDNRYLSNDNTQSRIDKQTNQQQTQQLKNLIINYDLMSYILRNKIEYGYILRKYEPHPDTQQTLPSFIENYIQKCSIQPTIPIPDFSLLFNFYNNFHVGKVSFFLDPKVRHFLVETNTSGKLYE